MKQKTINSLLVTGLVSILIIIPLIAYAETSIYNVQHPRNFVEILDGHATGQQDSSSRFLGEEITTSSSLVGQRIDRIGVSLEKVVDGQSLSGTVYAGVWQTTSVPSSSNAIKLFGSISANSVTDGLSYFNFTIDPPHTLASNTAVGVFYLDPTGVGDVNNQGIFVSGKSAGFDGTNTRATCYTNQALVTPNVDCFNVLGSGMSAQWVDDTGTDIIEYMILTDTFCSMGDNEDLLQCQEDAALVGVGEFLGNSVVNTAIQLGLISGDDTNPKTNGIGYLILAIAMAIFVGIMWVATRGDLMAIPNYVWIIYTIGIVGMLTSFGYLDATLLVITVIVVIALAAAKIRTQIGSGIKSFSGE